MKRFTLQTLYRLRFTGDATVGPLASLKPPETTETAPLVRLSTRPGGKDNSATVRAAVVSGGSHSILQITRHD